MSSLGHKDVFEANRQYYNEVAEHYFENEAYAYTPEIVSSVTQLLTQGAELCGRSGKFLDFGCGAGFLSRIVQAQNLMGEGIGVDASDSQVALYNQALGGTGFKARVGDACALDLEDGSIDMAGGYSVLHHFYDYSKLLDEITRVLKSGGVLYFDFEPNRAFKKLLKIPISMRRRFFDHSPSNSEQDLENVAEYHNNFEPGIDRGALLRHLSRDYQIIQTGCRIPHTTGMTLFKLLSSVCFAFSPCFYVLARKK